MYRLVLPSLLAVAQLPAQDRYGRLIRDILIFDAHIDALRDEHSCYELDIRRMRKGKFGAILFGP